MPNKIVYEDRPQLPYGNIAIDTSSDYAKYNNTDIYNVKKIFDDTFSPVRYASFEYKGTDYTNGATYWSSGDAMGFVSAWVSDANGNFIYGSHSENPKLIFNFESGNDAYYISTSYITLRFTTTVCDKMTLRFKTGTNTYVNVDVTEDDIFEEYNIVKALPKTTVKNFCGVEVIFKHTARPSTFATLWHIEFGKTYEIEDIVSLSYNSAFDFVSSDISVGTMDVEFLCDEELSFLDNQRVRVYHKEQESAPYDESCLVGTYWIADHDKLSDKLFSITATDSFGVIDSYVIEEHSVTEKTSATDIKTLIDNTISDQTTVRIIYHDDSSDPTTYNSSFSSHFPANNKFVGSVENVTVRRELAELAMLCQCYARVLPNGKIDMFYPATNPQYTISTEEIIGDASIKINKKTTSADYTATSYVRTAETVDGKTWYNSVKQSVTETSQTSFAANTTPVKISITRGYMPSGSSSLEHQARCDALLARSRMTNAEARFVTNHDDVKVGDRIRVETKYNGTVQGVVCQVDAQINNYEKVYSVVLKYGT